MGDRNQAVFRQNGKFDKTSNQRSSRTHGCPCAQPKTPKSHVPSKKNSQSRSSGKESSKNQIKNNKKRDSITEKMKIQKGQKRENQILGFARCLFVWMIRHIKLQATKYHLNIIYRHLLNLFEGVELKFLPKLFKLHLTTYFSIRNNQPLPKGGDKIRYLSLFPRVKHMETKVRRRIQQPHFGRVVLWSLMQCKSLSNQVPDEFIYDSYVSHSETVTKKSKTPENLIKEFAEFVTPWVTDVVNSYDDKTYLAKGAAYYDIGLDAKRRGEFIEDKSSYDSWSREFYSNTLDARTISRDFYDKSLQSKIDINNPCVEDASQEPDFFKFAKRVGLFPNKSEESDYFPLDTKGPAVFPEKGKNWSRDKGGVHTALLNTMECRNFNYSWSKHLNKNNLPFRQTPVHVHLTGPPGTGKSFLSNILTRKICRMFGRDLHSSVFQRNDCTDHWDGYESGNHFITVIDDICQKLGEKNDEPYSEIIPLISTIPYVPPMADLKHKGQKFQSDFIISSSNSLTDVMDLRCPLWGRKKQYTSIECFINDKDALTRRLHGAIAYDFHQVIRNKNSSINHRKTTYKVSVLEYAPDSRPKHAWKEPFICNYEQLIKVALVGAIERWTSNNRDFKTLLGHKATWSQEVGYSEESKIFYEFPVNPPPGKPSVMVHGIPEPLKVRIITKSHPYSWSLKALQKVMFKSLAKYPCFTPCFTPDYDLREILDRDQTDWSNTAKKSAQFISVDYVGATDNINFDMSQTPYKILADEFEKQGYPELAQAIRWETRSHFVHYPPVKVNGETKCVPSVSQSHGQFMGSLLSFPILCLLNAFLACKATKSDLKDLKIAIHGDDACGLLKPSEKNNWEKNGALVGLAFSEGKTYYSPYFVAIDSEIWTSKCKKGGKTKYLRKQKTGKFSCQLRVTESVPEALSRGILAGMKPDKIRMLNCKALANTPRDLAMPMSHGGLGKKLELNRVRNGKVYHPDRTLQNFKIYITDLLRLRKVKSRISSKGVFLAEIPKDLLIYLPDAVEYHVHQNLDEMFSHQQPMKDDEFAKYKLKIDRMSWSQLRKSWKHLKQDDQEEVFRMFMHYKGAKNITDLPPLPNSLFCKREKVIISMKNYSYASIQFLSLVHFIGCEDRFAALKILLPLWKPLILESLRDDRTKVKGPCVNTQSSNPYDRLKVVTMRQAYLKLFSQNPDSYLESGEDDIVFDQFDQILMQLRTDITSVSTLDFLESISADSSDSDSEDFSSETSYKNFSEFVREDCGLSMDEVIETLEDITKVNVEDYKFFT